MRQKINKKLSHLSSEQIEQLTEEYLQGFKIDDLLAKYEISARSSELVKLLPPKQVNKDCPYCEVLMYAPINSRSSSYLAPIFCQCSHVEIDNCICGGCTAKQKAIIAKKNESSIAAINQHYHIPSRQPSLLPHELSLKEAVFLVSLFLQSNFENACSIAPIGDCKDKLSPQPELDGIILEVLLHSNLIAIDPASSIEAFVFRNGIPSEYYPRRVAWVPLIGEGSEQVNEYMYTLISLIKSGNWPLSWYKDAADVWALISLYECLEIYEYYTSEHHLPAPISDKTKIIFRELIQELSLGRIQNVVLYNVKSSVANMVKENLHPRHAANRVMHACQGYVARAKVNGWEIKAYKRNLKTPRSIINHIFHDFFLKHSEKSDDIVCQAITPDYIGGSVLEISVHPSDFGGNIHLTKDNCINLKVVLNLNNDLHQNIEEAKDLDHDEIAFKIAKNKAAAFKWILTAEVPDIDDKVIAEAPVSEGQLPVFVGVTLEQDLLEEVLSAPLLEEHMLFMARIIDSAKSRMREM